MNAVSVEESRAVPVALEEAYDVVRRAPLTEVFYRRYGPFPPIREVRDQTGDWDAVGQSRTVVLADGGTAVETLTSVDPPRELAYRLDRFTGPLKPLVQTVEGAWRFEPAGTGTRITWAWTLNPANRAGSFALPVIGKLWHGYARQVLEGLEDRLLS